MTVLFRRKLCITYLAHQLTFGTVVLVKVDARGIASRTFTVFVDVTFNSTADGFDGLVVILITPLKVSDEIPVVPGFNIQDKWKFINLEFLILGRMGIIESPLFERDISADKI